MKLYIINYFIPYIVGFIRCVILKFSLTFLVFVYFSHHPVLAANGSYYLQLEPHTYSSLRGTEPENQTIAQMLLQWNEKSWQISLHWEGELVGRKDISFDLDRAWFSKPLSENLSGPEISLGRIHPWNVSKHPDSMRPWSLSAQSQPQNRGILLGNTFFNSSFPQPILLGWIGLHFWSNQDHSENFSWGFSATPIFIPSLGSQVTLSDQNSVSSSRFGRRPPGSVEVNGNIYPLRYQIDQSRIIQDVILQPQLMAQTHWRYSNSRISPKGWLCLSRSPTPDPLPDVTGFLRVTDSSLEAVAEVKPKFPQQFQLQISHLFPVHSSFSLYNSLQIRDEKTFGYELATMFKYVSLSLSDEFRSQKSPGKYDLGKAGQYLDLLLQIDGHFPLTRSFNLYSGVKTQLRQNRSYWLRLGTEWNSWKSASALVGVDVFNGADNTYFGEWRTNSRVFAQLRWKIDS